MSFLAAALGLVSVCLTSADNATTGHLRGSVVVDLTEITSNSSSDERRLRRCDFSRCDGCSGSVCALCRDEEDVKCCLEHKCRHCSGQQCESCHEQHARRCCRGKTPAISMCARPTHPGNPRPKCQTSRCNGCSGSACAFCRDEEEVKCCLEQKCDQFYGGQHDRCRQQHMNTCCQGKTPAVSVCSGHVQQTTPRPACQIGEYVHCFSGNPGMCSGNQCCTARSGQTWTCPSASVDHVPGCDLGKAYQC